MPERAQGASRRGSFFLHLHPARVRSRSLKPTTTFGLGLIALTLLGVLLLSGLVLGLAYRPSPEWAHVDVRDLIEARPFGDLMRRLHRVATDALLIVLLLHGLRVMVVAAGRGRRALNWLLGLGLATLILGLGFTGYLLPWDQRAYWGSTVGTEMLAQWPLIGELARRAMLGGAQVGAGSLLRFYFLHVAILPALCLGLLVYHLWRIRKDGGLVGSADDEPRVDAWPHLALREAVVVVATLAAVTALALLAGDALGPVADPLRPGNPEKAPWYFVAVQEMVSYQTLSGALIFPAVGMGALLLAPLLGRRPRPAEARAIGAGSLLLALLSGAAVSGAALWEHQAGGRWLAPLDPALISALGALAWGLWALARRRDAGGASLVAVAALLGAYVLYTVVGLWLRGPSWAWQWPWLGGGGELL